MKVSVPLIAYNQEKFIAQAIEGVLMQRTTFDFELLVADDCSTDGTRAIVEQLAARDPRIRILPRPHNLGMNRNFRDALQACRGQYVATLEGDDYWTDPTKLQRQADYLDEHPDVTLVHHGVQILEESTGRLRRDPRFHVPRRATLDRLLRRGNFLHTATVMFRNREFGPGTQAFFDLKIGDFVMHAMNAAHGAIAFLPRTMSVYRVHAGGVHSLLAENARHENMLATLRYLDEYFEGTRSDAIAQFREYVQTVQAIRGGDVTEARRHARARLRMGHHDAQSITAALVLYAPWLYRLARRVLS